MGVSLEGEAGSQEQHFFIAEGRCDSCVGAPPRANHPLRRTDLTFVPDFQGVIESDGDGVVFFGMRGFGRAYPWAMTGRRVGTQVSDDERFR